LFFDLEKQRENKFTITWNNIVYTIILLLLFRNEKIFNWTERRKLDFAKSNMFGLLSKIFTDLTIKFLYFDNFSGG
jgi:hypothetical protein